MSELPPPLKPTLSYSVIGTDTYATAAEATRWWRILCGSLAAWSIGAAVICLTQLSQLSPTSILFPIRDMGIFALLNVIEVGIAVLLAISALIARQQRRRGLLALASVSVGYALLCGARVVFQEPMFSLGSNAAWDGEMISMMIQSIAWQFTNAIFPLTVGFIGWSQARKSSNGD